MRLDKSKREVRISMRLALWMLLISTGWQPAVSQETPHSGHRASDPRPVASPYAGEESRPLVALSEEEVRALLAGEGLGFAKVAELNHFPGPRHVLDLAAELRLEESQRATLLAEFERMQSAARKLGAEIVTAERALQDAFRAGSITSEELKRNVDGIARLQGELRAVHLIAHLNTRSILSHEQIAKYDALRGYGAHDRSSHQH